jgi:hypothetical protein
MANAFILAFSTYYWLPLVLIFFDNAPIDMPREAFSQMIEGENDCWYFENSKVIFMSSELLRT